MKFWLALVSVRESAQLAQVAQSAEAAGFHGLMIGDELIRPDRRGARGAATGEGTVASESPDPWVLFAHLGALTRRLRFASSGYLAALRDPLTVAKSVATAAVLTQGRVVLGVAAGSREEEYRAAHSDFATRGRRLDELLGATRELLSGRFVSHEGTYYSFAGVLSPVPTLPVRIWCGGASEPALQRAARQDGWLAPPLTLAQTDTAVAAIRIMRRDAGLPEPGFEVALPLAEPVNQEAIDSLGELGIDDLIVVAPWLPTPWDGSTWLQGAEDAARVEVKQAALERYASALIHKLR
jgi:alkanesulfonate monooxygenase SsuD/methylene tetrahydromethanopterin reductase-like flavin-dependent oxidoreductase (luciferase family)